MSLSFSVQCTAHSPDFHGAICCVLFAPCDDPNCCAGVANFMTGNHGGAASMGYNGFSKAFTAAVLFRASAAFDRAVTSPCRNIESMMSAIGDKVGCCSLPRVLM